MFDGWKRSRAAARVRPGNGQALAAFRWWQLPGRALFHLYLTELDYAVDIRHWQNQSSGNVEAHLYRNGRQYAVSKLPATFPVPGGIVDVAMSGFGIKRCHYVPEKGSERQLTPDPATAEGRRARMDHRHPGASRLIGRLSVVMLLIGVTLLVLEVAPPISQIPPIAESVGTFTSPIDLPWWLTLALALATATASAERALRMRYHWLLDAAGN